MIKLSENIQKELLGLYKSKRIHLEGNILKVIDFDVETEFGQYINDCIEKETTTRKKRLEVNKKIQLQNTELIKWKDENIRIQEELVTSLDETKTAKEEAECAKEDAERLKEDAEQARIEAEKAKIKSENARQIAENDLELAQKKSQFELIGTIVKVALWVIIGVGVITTTVFIISLLTNKDTAIIGSTWSNIVGILLTNAFSIVGTIMGVKYASEKK